MSKDETAKSQGRPTDYRAKFDEQARKLCLLGATDPEIADFFEVSLATIKNWKNAHPSFVAALKAGKMFADAEVAEKLYTKAINGDVTAQIFWLKNRRRQGWRDKFKDDEAEPETNIYIGDGKGDYKKVTEKKS